MIHPRRAPGAARQLERLCWLVALALGGLQAWGRRHVSADGLRYMGADGIAYLDQGDAWLRGDWAHAVNAMWSPLYPWLTGLVLRLVHPTPYQEFTVVRLLNFALYAAALAAFAYCLHALLCAHTSEPSAGPTEAPTSHDNAATATTAATPANTAATTAATDAATDNATAARAGLSRRVLLGIGYALFIWTSLQMNRVSRVSPDILVAALVYLATGLLLRLRAGDKRRRTFGLLGLTLGVGYLAKTVMFPLAFVWLACAACAGGTWRRTAPRVLLALGVFLCVAAPLVGALSRASQRLTIGASARLNYAWYVNGVTPYTHWQGGPAGSGTPTHPTRKLTAAPAAYEFATPVAGTYPPWYDPSYWYAGVQPHFDLRQQLHAIGRNGKLLARFFSGRLFPAALLFTCGALVLASGRVRLCTRTLVAHWPLLVPALAAGALYLLVNVELRYLAPFGTLIFLSLYASVPRPTRGAGARLYAGLSLVPLLACAVALAPETARDVLATVHVTGAAAAAADVQWQIAAALNQRGVLPGAHVAVVGDTMYAAWPRLARVRVVAEVPAAPGAEAAQFWAAEPARQRQVLAALARSGAQAVVATDVPRGAVPAGWQPLAATGALVYFPPPE